MLLAAFPYLRQSPDEAFLSLRRYIGGRPERFFDSSAYALCLEWLTGRDGTDRARLQQHFGEVEAELSGAFKVLRQINAEDWHDQPVDELIAGGDSYDLLRLLDTRVHPTYLRLVEGVLAPLLRPIAAFSRTDRKKGTALSAKLT